MLPAPSSETSRELDATILVLVEANRNLKGIVGVTASLR